jgi:hypothetical protein
MSSCSSSSDRNSSSPVPSYSPSPKCSRHLKVLAQQLSPTPKTSKTVQSLPRWSWRIRTLGTAQQYLALVLGKYRMTSNQDECGFAAVTSLFLLSRAPRYTKHKIQFTTWWNRSPLRAWTVYSRMMFFYLFPLLLLCTVLASESIWVAYLYTCNTRRTKGVYHVSHGAPNNFTRVSRSEQDF